MQGKPYQSCLIPYEEEILVLRHKRPPTSYREIAELLLQKYQLSACRETIFKFIRVRSRTRRMFGYKRLVPVRKLKSATAATVPKPACNQTKLDWNFKPSDRYNLTRLPPEEAEARRKKLEAEGH